MADPRLTVRDASVIPAPVSLIVRAGAAPVTYPDPGLLTVIAVIDPAVTVAVAVAVIPWRLCNSFGVAAAVNDIGDPPEVADNCIVLLVLSAFTT